MNDIKLQNFTVFMLFFGLALVEAIQDKSLVAAGLFIALGTMSLWIDFRKK